jgi:hypothetical protein
VPRRSHHLEQFATGLRVPRWQDRLERNPGADERDSYDLGWGRPRYHAPFAQRPVCSASVRTSECDRCSVKTCHFTKVIYRSDDALCAFAGLFRADEGTRTSTFCMANAGDRSLPFAPVRSNRLFAAVPCERANGRALERTPNLAILATPGPGKATPCVTALGYARASSARAPRKRDSGSVCAEGKRQRVLEREPASLRVGCCVGLLAQPRP